jgi:hypothetical protein
MDIVKQSRVNWTDNECELVARRFLELKSSRPELGEGAMLMEAQRVLPEGRRRPSISGFSQAPRLLKVLNQLGSLGTVLADRHQRAEVKPVPPPPVSLTDVATEKLVEVLRERQPDLFCPEEIIKKLDTKLLVTALVQREPQLFPESTPTAHLLDLILRRFFTALAEERQRLGVSVVEQVLGHLAADRAKFETRLFSIESKLANGVLRRDNIPVAPAPAEENAYMPIILLAGGDRQEFQRLQAQLTNASIRLQKIDVSKRYNITIPTHDLVIIWQQGLDAEMVGIVRSRCARARAVLYSGVFANLGPLIVEEAQKIRDEKKNSK